MTAEQAIEILEHKTGYAVWADDCDKDTVVEALRMALDALKEKAKINL